MKNILNDKPTNKLKGRLLASVNFVHNDDVQSKNILDIGCGYGWCELNFLKRGVNKMIGIEITEKDLSTAAKNIKNNKTKFVLGSATELPFKDNFFDTVVSWDVIEHIPKNTENKMFSEVYRVLKPNGTFYLSTPYLNFFSTILDPAWWLIGHRHYSQDELLKYAANNNFVIKEIAIKGKWWSLLTSLNFYVSKWVFKRKPVFNDFFVLKDNEEYLQNGGFVNIFIKFKKNK